MSKIEELISSLEKATGPNRELDILIGQATAVYGWRVCDDGCVECYIPDGHEYGEGWFDTGQELPAYTASIDAAMTLVPEGWYCVEILRDNEGEWVPRLHQNQRGLLSAHANHPRLPIALCIAALRARALNPKDET